MRFSRFFLSIAGISLVSLVFFLAASVSSQASELSYTDLYITIRDISSGETITSMPVHINWQKIETGGTINLTKYLDKRGTFSYRISPGKWKLNINLDNISTPENDYYGEAVYTIETDIITTSEILYVNPVGSAEVKVSDAAGKLIAEADLTFKCKSYVVNGETDMFGSYKAINLPTGECKVSAAYDSLVGSQSVAIIPGQVSAADILLSESVAKDTSYLYYLLFAVLIIIVLVVAYIFLRKRITHDVKQKIKDDIRSRMTRKASARQEAGSGKEHKLHHQPHQPAKAAGDKSRIMAVASGASAASAAAEGKEELNPRARDIMKTLNEKEQKVVAFILENNNKSTQASIRNGTGIPKTTLVRIFQSLEAKKVIKIEVIGKLKKIEFTDWFLGKD